MVSLLNDHFSVTLPLLEDAVPMILQTLSEATTVEWYSYLYILESMLVEHKESSSKRVGLIKVIAGPIIHKSFRLWETDKIMQF